jgi:uncharacterized SAM-binding protein YcdF (DUF218 family)
VKSSGYFTGQLSQFQFFNQLTSAMSFLYNLFLELLYPTSLCALLLVAAAVFRKRQKLSRVCFWAAFAVLMVCGNGWLVGGMTRHLEWQYLPPSHVPEADCIVILSGGIMGQTPPRPMIEVGEAGDRVLYGAYLYRQGKAPRIICTGNVATGGFAARPISEDMADFLEMLGVPKAAIITETKSGNTHEHAKNLYPVLRERGFTNVLLVTSAMHMPRSIGTFRRLCPGIKFVPAPTDFRETVEIPRPWYNSITALIPTPKHLSDFSEVMHEYLGMEYYRMRGWM